MICPDCGSEILKGHRICSVCGYEMTQEEWNREKHAGKRGKGLRVVAVIAVIALAAGLVAGVSMLRRKGGDGQQTASATLGVVGPTPWVEPMPTPWISPTPWVTPTPTTWVTPTPTPEPTRWVTPTPTPLISPAGPQDGDQIASRRDAIRLALEAREEGISELTIQELSISQDEMWDAFGEVAGYEAGTYWEINGGYELRMNWRAGIRIWSAIQDGTLYALSEEDQRMAALAQETVDGLIDPWMTDLEKEIAIHDFIIYNTDYTIDPGLATESLYGFFNHGKLQCSGYADTFYLLGRMAGLEIVNVRGTVMENGEPHEWNLIRLDGLWYAVDVTWDDPLGGGSESGYYMNFPHDLFRGLRVWDEDTLPDGAYASQLDGRWYYGAAPYAWDVDEGVRIASSLIDTGQKAILRVDSVDMLDQISQGLAEHYVNVTWYSYYDDLPGVILAEFWLE